MKKILFFHHYNSPYGAGLSFLHILRSIDLTAYDVVVCLPSISGDLEEHIEELGIRVIHSAYVTPYMHFSGNETPFLSLRHLKNLKSVIESRAHIQKIIDKEKPNIVAVNSATLFWIGRIAEESGQKALCFNRETYRHGLLGIRNEIVKRELADHFDTVVFLSYFDIEQSRKGRAKYVRITDKVDVTAYEKLDCKKERENLKLPQNDKLILYVGGVPKLKGPMTILRAMVEVQHPQAKLVFLQYNKPEVVGFSAKVKDKLRIILGRNPYYTVDKCIRMNRIQDKVIFRGATDQVEEYFVACDVVVFPSHKAHQARPAYEAAIAHKPIIISDFPNTREFVDETNGWLFAKDNPHELAQQIDFVLENIGSIKVKKAYSKAYKENNLSTLSEELKIVLAELCKE